MAVLDGEKRVSEGSKNEGKGKGGSSGQNRECRWQTRDCSWQKVDTGWKVWNEVLALSFPLSFEKGFSYFASTIVHFELIIFH